MSSSSNWRKPIIVVIIGIILFVFLCWVVIYGGMETTRGTSAKFSVLALVDNSENDYIDIKLVEEGTEMFAFKWSYNVGVCVDNLVQWKEIPEEFTLINDMGRINFGANVVERGKAYKVRILYSGGVLAFDGNVQCI